MKIPVFPLLLLATMLHMNLPGTVIYVNHAATGACDGSSWIDAFTCLQPAIDAAVEGDEIWVAEGTYYPTSDHGLNLGTGGRHFRMKTGVGIYGGFNGQETERDERDWSVQATVLSGDLGLPDDKNDNAWHVFFHPDDYNVDYTAILDGFTITMGMAAYHMDNECGGGMYLRAGSPGITNCLFTKNEAREGGGVYAIHSQAVFTNCRFSENDAGDGGGIYLLESQVEITNSVFEKHSGGGWGGGLYVKDSSLNLLHCSIINNSTMSSGPGIEISGSEGVITHSIFRKNSSAYSGGAVCSSNSSLKISDTVIMENRGASNAGMGFYSSTGSILNCLITNNSSEGIGSASGLMSGNIGGLDLSRSSPEILNCVITGNSAAKSVGGIKMYESSPKIVNCIINGNIASEGAGG
ncbi:MAG TPA: right-handed parallel beta-helix repeat-containing protein, partial [Candidatus Sumerlaeota bacterium]|nr:right-handed parallel beta-helix repeat-containing protein [Candidatus Sumerlaeota bacterium]